MSIYTSRATTMHQRWLCNANLRKRETVSRPIETMPAPILATVFTPTVSIPWQSNDMGKTWKRKSESELMSASRSFLMNASSQSIDRAHVECRDRTCSVVSSRLVRRESIHQKPQKCWKKSRVGEKKVSVLKRERVDVNTSRVMRDRVVGVFITQELVSSCTSAERNVGVFKKTNILSSKSKNIFPTRFTRLFKIVCPKLTRLLRNYLS